HLIESPMPQPKLGRTNGSRSSDARHRLASRHSRQYDSPPMAVVKLPDGSTRDVAAGTTVMQLAESIGRGLAKAAVVGKVDGKLVDLFAVIPPGQHEVSIVTDRDPDGLFVLRHSTAH